MEFSLYVFLFTLFIEHFKLSKSSSSSRNTRNGVQQLALDNISPTNFASKATKTFGVYNSNCQNFNKFERFNSWTCNTPQMTDFETALLVIKQSMTIQNYRYRILVFGEISKREIGDAILGDVSLYQTWIYYDESNSWKMIASVANGPTWMHRLHLVTFCSSRAIILSPDAINSTWIFTFEEMKWKRVAIVGSGPNWTNIRYDIFAVAVESEHSLCSCNQDVFFFYPNEDRNQIVSYRLICVIEQKTYRWEKVGNCAISFFRSLRLVGGWSGQTTVFAIVDECLWKYSVKKSIWKETKLCFQNGTLGIVLNAVYSDFLFVNDTQQIIYISIDRSLVRKLSVSNGVAFEEKIHLNNFRYWFLYARRPSSYVLRFASQDVKYYLPWDRGYCGFIVLRVKRRFLEWEATGMKGEDIIPLHYTFQSLWRDTYYRIVLPFHDVWSMRPVMWLMNLSTMRWQMERYLDVTKIHITKQMMTQRTVSMHMQENVWLVVSSEYTMLIESTDHIRLMSSPRPSRFDFTVVTINSTSALLFGGQIWSSDGNKVYNDLWQFSLTHRMWEKVQMIDSSKSDSWYGLNTNASKESLPSPRYNHAAAVIEFEMFVFGGYGSNHSLKLDLWRYNMINNSWRYLEPTNKIPYIFSDKHVCHFSATAQSKMLWIASKCPLYVWHDNFEGNFYLWMFIVHLETWHSVALDKLENMSYKYLYSSLDFWRGYLQSLQPSSLVYIKAGCPEGLGSSNISRFPCDICKVGFYSDANTKKCRKCPNGTTTREERSSKLTDCNLCVTGYCRHGRCLVVSNSLTQSPLCACTIGFTGSHCQDATYYYIGTGCILFIGIITLLVVVLRRIIKKRREGETSFRRHIQILNEAWQISWPEIELQDEIGGGASGRVWKAQYRNIDVAVKMLIDNNESQSSLEFTAEIKFMQTMRHRNIVLFIGAGKTSPQAQPFLVVEFAHRGSLRHVLDDVSIAIDQNRKIDFALDASKGMEFLHKLDPTRIHRDLKSENLLVCKSWIVKVADFGLGRLFGGAQKNRQSRQSNSLSSNNSESELLVEIRDLSRDGIGTVRWSAPELARRESYDGSIDIYRYSTKLISLYSIII